MADAPRLAQPVHLAAQPVGTEASEWLSLFIASGILHMRDCVAFTRTSVTESSNGISHAVPSRQHYIVCQCFIKRLSLHALWKGGISMVSRSLAHKCWYSNS